MSAIHHLRSEVLPAMSSRAPCWGHLTWSASRYGEVSCVLAVYPPDSSAAARRLAEAHRCFAPGAFGGGMVLWVVLCALGAAPLPSALVLAAVLIPIGVLLAIRSRPVRARTIMLSCASSLLRDDEGSLRRRQLEVVAEALQDAAFACRRGYCSPEAFDRTWRAAYGHAAALAHAWGRGA